MDKKNKGLIIVMVILLLGLLCSIGYICYDKGVFGGKKKDANNDVKNNSLNNSIKDVDDNKDSSIYGFAYVLKNSDEYKIIALNSNGPDIELNSGIGEITFYIKNNRLLFINKLDVPREPNHTIKTYYVDLNKHPYKANLLTEGINNGAEYDFNDEYIFSAMSGEKQGIKRYNLKTKEEKIFEVDKYVHGIYIYNNKVYYSTLWNVPEETFYSIDFNGEKKEKITKEEYEKIVSNIGYTEQVSEYNKIYLIKNNKKVYFKDNIQNLYLDDKIIYTVSNPSKSIVLGYSSDENTIAFREITMNVPEEPKKYYLYHIDTEKLEEIDEQSAVFFREIIIK